ISPFAGLALGIGQLAYIAPIVVTEKQSYIIRHTHTIVVVVLHLFIQRPELGRMLGIFACNVFYDLPLIFNNVLQETYILFITHGFVTIPALSDGYYRFQITATFNTASPNIPYPLLVLTIVPRPAIAIPLPLVLRSCHRFMVGSSHHDSHFIRQSTVF